MAIETAIASGVGAVAGAFKGIFSGGESTTEFTLSPEYAVQYMDWLQGAMTDTDAMSDSLTTVLNYTDSQLAAVGDYLSGTLPNAEFMKQMTSTAQEITAAFGGDALAAIESGFLDETTARMSGLIEEREGQTWNANQKELDDLRAMEASGYSDPTLEAKLTDQRKSLEQSLARAGVSPAQRSIALQQFEASAEQQRFTRSEELKTGATNRAMARIGASGQALSAGVASMQTAANLYLEGRKNKAAEAQQGFGNVMGMLQFGQSGASTMAALFQQRLNNAAEGMAAQMGVLAGEQSMWGQLGKTNLSKAGRQLLASGAVGPGSLEQQTGIARGLTGPYYKGVNLQEQDATKGEIDRGDIARNPGDVIGAVGQRDENGFRISSPAAGGSPGANVSNAAGGGSPYVRPSYVPPGMATNRGVAPTAPNVAGPSPSTVPYTPKV